MQKPTTYKVTREYRGQYSAEEMIRRIVRIHLTEDQKENAGGEFPVCGTYDDTQPVEPG